MELLIGLAILALSLCLFASPFSTFRREREFLRRLELERRAENALLLLEEKLLTKDEREIGCVIQLTKPEDHLLEATLTFDKEGICRRRLFLVKP